MELLGEPRLPANRGHSDLSLTREGGCLIVSRKHKVELGNSG